MFAYLIIRIRFGMEMKWVIFSIWCGICVRDYVYDRSSQFRKFLETRY